MWLQKISKPSPWKNLEFPWGWGGGGQMLRKFERGGGLDNKSQGNNFELSMKIATDLVDQF